MRIVGGSRKGARIAAPRGTATRPTSDRVRENAFNLIGPVDGASVLELFAGSGAMGLEALSRGAASAVFVERDAAAVRAIEANLRKLRLRATVLRVDALRALAAEAAAGRAYDVVLADPPYERWPDLERPLGPLLAAVVAPGGVVLVETPARVEPSLPLTRRTSRRYGSTRLTLYEP